MEFPKWNTFTPEAAAAELPRLLADAETAVAAVEHSSPAAYEDFVWRLDDATRALWRCWGSVSHLLGVMNSEAWRKVEETFQPQIVAFSLRVGQSKRLYALAKEVLGATEDPVRRRILEKMIQSAELAGVGLDGAKLVRFNEIEMELARLAMDFSNAVIDATKAFSFEKDARTYTIDDANYPETMKHCADREVRERLMRARSTRAAENDPRIDRILSLRRERAAILGYPDFAALSLATKCAPSTAAVMKMIDDLDDATAAIAAREDRELADFAAPGWVEAWDVAYFAERLRERKYSYGEEELKRHFELEDVVRGLFRITKLLFDVDVVELEGAAKPEVWREDVRFFEVREAGRVIANFYFDPYVHNGLKQGGAWMNEFRNRSVRPDGCVLPLAVIVTNFQTPDADGRTLLPLREVETLFHEFGHALQQMLTRIDEEDAAGINLVEWDAVEVASQFMENWCLDDRTGIVLPDELKAKVRAAKNYRAANACRRQLAFAKTDIQLHSAASDRLGSPQEVKHANFNHFGLATVPEDRFLSAFTHIFAGGYAAGYYGYKWAEVMSADCFGAFEEAGLGDDRTVREVGRRYRETILALGGSISALEVFRRFRGRDPKIDAILRQQDLK